MATTANAVHVARMAWISTSVVETPAVAMATAAKTVEWAWRPTPGPFRKSRGALMTLVKLLPQLLPRNRRSHRGAEGEPAVFRLGTIDAPTIGQIEGYKQVWTQ